jgi:phosphoribosylglycinamide formyltransferase-1
VHFVDEGMDTGPVIIQAAVPVSPDDTEESLSERILRMEHKIYPEAIRLYAEGRLRVEGRIVKITGYESTGGVLVNPPLSSRP